jgi:putative IMPACT (imprinted ancient) family translation regulator
MDGAVGVIREYGGVNLGTGGLARAYGGTAKMALEAAKIVDFVEMREVDLKVQYKQLDELTRLVAQLRGNILDKVFGDEVRVKISLPVPALAALERFT